MKKNISLIIAFLAICINVQSQDSLPVKKYHVAVFAPLYLDSAFNGEDLKNQKSFPKYAMPGFDFVQGTQLAMDSLNAKNSLISLQIFDTKSSSSSISNLISYNILDSIDLIIGSVKDAEITTLAKFAKSKNIPFVSAIAPNDAGVQNNPFFIITNGTLKAHCEAIYSYLLQKHGSDNIYLCRKKGGQEDKIADYFKARNEIDSKPLLNVKTIDFVDDFTLLKSKLDSTKKNILIGGSLSEDFATELVKAAYEIKNSYPIEMIGMPNWNSFAGLKKADVKDFEILYTSTYYNGKADKFSKKIQSDYLKKFKATPSDFVYKGFEAMYLFTKLLIKYPNDFGSHLNDVSKQAFSEFNFMPVYTKKDNVVPDYFENKHLYFMKIINGKLVRAWDK